MRRNKILIGFIFVAVITSFVMPQTLLAAKERKAAERRPRFFKGPKRTIAIIDFEDKASVPGGRNVVQGIADVLATALRESGYFTVVGRKDTKYILKEQHRQRGPRTQASDVSLVKRKMNPHLIIGGSVVEFRQSLAVGDMKLRGEDAHVAINITLYDPLTGDIIDFIRCDGTSPITDFNNPYVDTTMAVNMRGFKDTSLGMATREAVNKAVYFIATKAGKIPWNGRIANVEGDTIYINAGRESNISLNNTFDVYRLGEIVIDPNTGLRLGLDEKRMGKIKVTEVNKDFSKAKTLSGGGFTRDDIIRYE